MNKNQAWHSIASSVAAGIITYFLLDFTVKDWETIRKTVIIVAVGALAFFIALLTGRASKDKTGDDYQKTEIGTRISSQETVEIEDVKVNKTAEEDIKIGTDISTNKNVKIKGVEIGPQKDK